MGKYFKAGQVTDDNMALRIECLIPKSTSTHSECVILLLSHYNNGCMNTPQCYVIRTLPVRVTVKLMERG